VLAGNLKFPVVAVASPVMLVNVLPPSVLTCHCTSGQGLPVAIAWKRT
jgi:hypothetical protein